MTFGLVVVNKGDTLERVLAPHIKNLNHPEAKFDFYNDLTDIETIEPLEKGINERRASLNSKAWDEIMEKGFKMTVTSKDLIEAYHTKENFVNAESHNATYRIFITPDGAWHHRPGFDWFDKGEGTIENILQYYQDWDKVVDYINSHECNLYLLDFYKHYRKK